MKYNQYVFFVFKINLNYLQKVLFKSNFMCQNMKIMELKKNLEIYRLENCMKLFN